MYIKNIAIQNINKSPVEKSTKDYEKLAYKLVKKSRYYKSLYLKDTDLMANIATEIALADSSYDGHRGVTLTAYRMSRINWELCKYNEQKERENIKRPLIYADKTSVVYNDYELRECIQKAPLSIKEKTILNQRLFWNSNFTEIGNNLQLSGTHVKNIFVSACQKIYQRYF